MTLFGPSDEAAAEVRPKGRKAKTPDPVSSGVRLVQDIVKALREQECKGTRASTALEHFLDMCASSMAKPAFSALGMKDRADALEATYGRAERQAGGSHACAELFGKLILGLEGNGCRDVLGPVAREVGALNDAIGQFFTPWELCVCMAKISLHDVKPIYQDQGYLTVCEPASGAGAMLLAVRQELIELEINPAHVWIDATDLSRTAAQMTYVQCAVAGFPGIVKHGDTLRGEHWEYWLTPMTLQFIARFGLPWKRSTEPVPQSVEAVDRPPDAVPDVPLGQIALF